LFIVGIIIGLILGYLVNPTEFTGANPERLNQAAQDQWIKSVAVAFNEGSQYPAETAADLLSRVDTPAASISRMLGDANLAVADRAALEAIQPVVANVAGTPTPQPPILPLEILEYWILPLLVFAILTPIVVLVWRLLFYPNIVAPRLDDIHAMRDPNYRAERDAARARIAEAKTQKEFLINQKQNQVVDAELGEPVMTNLAIFSGGYLDQSFEIELPLDKGGDFLGQSGVAIAESVDPDPVAVELWLFDMFSNENKKAILITPQGNADPAIRSRLEADVDNPATDIVVAAPGAKFAADSQKLKLEGEISSLEINDKGRFASFRMTVRAWQKDAQTAGVPAPAPSPVMAPPPIPVPPPAGGRSMDEYADMQFDPPPAAVPPAGGRPMDDYANIQFDPPPAPVGGRPLSDYDDTQFDPPPVSPPPPAGGRPLTDYDNIQFDAPPSGMQPLQPPPLQYPPGMAPNSGDDYDDDPFGGTGDFTPLPPTS
ncbi:MAG: hypothetical protein ACPG7F_19940, partial [Aggregatilineales bacterium]